MSSSEVGNTVDVKKIEPETPDVEKLSDGDATPTTKESIIDEAPATDVATVNDTVPSDVENPVKEPKAQPQAGFFTKLFAILLINFMLSVGVVYGIVAARTFSEPRTRTGWLVVISILAGVITYAFLYYTQKTERKLIIVPQLITLYIFIASASILVAYHASQSVYSAAIIMYAMVAVAIALLCMLLLNFFSSGCMKSGGKLWYTITLLVGLLVPLLYLGITVFVAQRPIALPNGVLDALRKSSESSSGNTDFSLWRKIVLFAVSSFLSASFIVFLLAYAGRFIKCCGEDKLTERTNLIKLVINVYIYITLPLVAVAHFISWLVQAIIRGVRSKRNGNEEEEMKEDEGVKHDEENPAKVATESPAE